MQVKDESSRKGMLRKARSMKFQYQGGAVVQYGGCAKYGKPVSFIPNT